MDARVSNGVIQIGVLGIKSNVRLNLSADQQVTLLNEDGLAIGAITLSPKMQGDRNGYINDLTLKLEKIV
jgi:hypothetical protein